MAKKLAYLKAKHGGTTSGVLKRAIEAYYKQEAERSATPLKLLEDAGFVGCAPGASNLSTNYKRELIQSLRSKVRADRR